tara:strand:+ start:852 stop:2462 length:1611 start_codon:yes stop_codon:yes gene_type:complete
MFKIKIALLTVLSGVVMWLAHNYSILWFVSLIGLIPILYIVYTQNLKHYQNFLVGFVAGTIMLAGVMLWHWNMLPLDWAGINNSASELFLVFYIWILSSTTAGLIGLWTLGLGYLKRNNWFDLLLAPALWVVIEFIRSIVVSILWHGEGSTIGSHWSISFVGYDLAAANFLLPFGAIGGVYILSFIVILFNLLLFFYFRDYLEKQNLTIHYKLAGVVILVIVIFNIGNSIIRHQSEPEKIVPVAVVNTYLESFSRITKDQFGDITDSHKALLSTIKKENRSPKIIIFPEDSRFLVGLTVAEEQNFLKEIFNDQEVLIIDSARIPKEEGKPVALTFNFLNITEDQIVFSDKQFLIPHGEYIPYLSAGILRLTGNGEWVDNFSASRGFSKGKNVKLVDFMDFKIGALACSEAMSLSFNRKLVDQGTGFIINIASHSLFNGSKILYNQILNMGKLRAIENNRYYVHAGNFVPSFVIDNQGRLVQESDWGEDSLIYQDIAIIESDSFYNRFGRWIFSGLFILIIFIGLLVRLKPKFGKYI